MSSNNCSFCPLVSAKKSSTKSFVNGSGSCLSNGFGGSSGDLGIITGSIFSFLFSIIVAQLNLSIEVLLQKSYLFAFYQNVILYTAASCNGQTYCGDRTRNM